MKKIVYALLLMMLLCTGLANASQPLTLNQSKQLALQNNCRIQNSRLEIDAAREQKKAAFTHYFPSVSAGGAMFSADDNLVNIHTTVLNIPVDAGLLKKGTVGMVSAIQPVFAGGRIVNTNRLASLGEDVGKQKDRLSQNDVLLKTEELYWQVVSLDEKLRTLQKYEELLNRLLAQTQDAYDAGIVLKNDVLKVRLKQSEVLLKKSKAENGRTLAAMAFCQYIGIPYDPQLVLSDAPDAAADPQADFIDHKAAVESRPEYKLLDASVRAEELKSKIKLGEYLPQAGIGVAGLYMKMDEGDGSNNAMIFGTVSIPLSGWWEASHTMSERRIKEKIAQNNFRDSSEQLLLQMQKARQDLADAYKQVRLSEDAKRQATENLEINQDSFDNGLSGMTDLLEALALLHQANDQLTDAKAAYQTKRVAYLQMTGR